MKNENRIYKVREVTSQQMRCAGIGCPQIYEVTPQAMRCGVGPCPAVYQTNKEYVIVGKVVKPEELAEFERGLGRKINIGQDEHLIRVDKKLIDGRELGDK